MSEFSIAIAFSLDSNRQTKIIHPSDYISILNTILATMPNFPFYSVVGCRLSIVGQSILNEDIKDFYYINTKHHSIECHRIIRLLDIISIKQNCTIKCVAMSGCLFFFFKIRNRKCCLFYCRFSYVSFRNCLYKNDNNNDDKKTYRFYQYIRRTLTSSVYVLTIRIQTWALKWNENRAEKLNK